jgi:hypothetical protein
MPREELFSAYGNEGRGLGVTGEAIRPAEVIDRFGVGGNAESLILAVQEHNPPEITGAGQKAIRPGLTAAFRKALLGDPETGEGVGEDWPQGLDVREIAGEGATVLDVAVRGIDDVVYVARDSGGVTYKGTFKLGDPEGTHVSQAEVLARPDRSTSGVLGPRLLARQAEAEVAQATLEARERAIVKRERELAEREAQIAEKRQETLDEAQANLEGGKDAQGREASEKSPERGTAAGRGRQQEVGAPSPDTRPTQKAKNADKG